MNNGVTSNEGVKNPDGFSLGIFPRDDHVEGTLYVVTL